MAFCLGADVYNSAYLGTKELIKAMGGKGVGDGGEERIDPRSPAVKRTHTTPEPLRL